MFHGRPPKYNHLHIGVVHAGFQAGIPRIAPARLRHGRFLSDRVGQAVRVAAGVIVVWAMAGAAKLARTSKPSKDFRNMRGLIVSDLGTGDSGYVTLAAVPRQRG